MSCISHPVCFTQHSPKIFLAPNNSAHWVQALGRWKVQVKAVTPRSAVWDAYNTVPSCFQATIVLLGRTNMYALHHHVREGVLLCPCPALVGWYSLSPVTSLYLTVSVGKALVSICLQLTHIAAQAKRRHNYILLMLHLMFWLMMICLIILCLILRNSFPYDKATVYGATVVYVVESASRRRRASGIDAGTFWTVICTDQMDVLYIRTSDGCIGTVPLYYAGNYKSYVQQCSNHK